MQIELPTSQERADNPRLNEICEYVEFLEELVKVRNEKLDDLSNKIDAMELESTYAVSKAGDLDEKVIEPAYRHFLRLESDYPEFSTVRYSEQGRFVESVQSLFSRIAKDRGLETSFQSRVAPWMQECFGAKISSSTLERNHRFLEEALELVQSLGMTKHEVLLLVDYAYDRPAGDPPQEVGGVMVTLAALCLAAKMDMHECAETELARVWTKVPQIRAKHAAKPKHSPLPQAAKGAWMYTAPSFDDGDYLGQAWSLGVDGEIELLSIDDIHAEWGVAEDGIVAWQPTGLSVPARPVQEGA